MLAALYIDKSGRLCATMNVYEHLRTDSPYKKDEKVTGRIYEISKNFGAFVAVDNCFSGLIPKKELFGDTELRIGDQVTARVVKVLEDGKLTLSVREKPICRFRRMRRRSRDCWTAMKVLCRLMIRRRRRSLPMRPA